MAVVFLEELTKRLQSGVKLKKKEPEEKPEIKRPSLSGLMGATTLKKRDNNMMIDLFYVDCFSTKRISKKNIEREYEENFENKKTFDEMTDAELRSMDYFKDKKKCTRFKQTKEKIDEIYENIDKLFRSLDVNLNKAYQEYDTAKKDFVSKNIEEYHKNQVRTNKKINDYKTFFYQYARTYKNNIESCKDNLKSENCKNDLLSFCKNKKNDDICNNLQKFNKNINLETQWFNCDNNTIKYYCDNTSNKDLYKDSCDKFNRYIDNNYENPSILPDMNIDRRSLIKYCTEYKIAKQKLDNTSSRYTSLFEKWETTIKNPLYEILTNKYETDDNFTIPDDLYEAVNNPNEYDLNIIISYIEENSNPKIKIDVRKQLGLDPSRLKGSKTYDETLIRTLANKFFRTPHVNDSQSSCVPVYVTKDGKLFYYDETKGKWLYVSDSNTYCMPNTKDIIKGLLTTIVPNSII